MPVLSKAEIKMVTDIATEMALHRGGSFDKAATGYKLARAALIDPAFKKRLAEMHRRLKAHEATATATPRRKLSPTAPLFRALEREAEAVLSG